MTALLAAIEGGSASSLATAVSQAGTLDTAIIKAEATADAAFYASLGTAQQAIDQELLAAGLDVFGNFGDGLGGCLAAASTTTTTPTVADIVTAEVARLTKLLTLTSTQMTEATGFFTTGETAAQTARASLATAQTALETAIEGNNATTIATDVAAIGALDTQIIQAEATADAALCGVLTTAQQTIYKELLAGGLSAPGFEGQGGDRGKMAEVRANTKGHSGETSAIGRMSHAVSGAGVSGRL